MKKNKMKRKIKKHNREIAIPVSIRVSALIGYAAKAFEPWPTLQELASL